MNFCRDYEHSLNDNFTNFSGDYELSKKLRTLFKDSKKVCNLQVLLEFTNSLKITNFRTI